jgi:hypothetical protein
MNARKLKYIAYNERVSQAEEEIAGINCDVADFLSGMSSTGTITVCINAGASMKKNERILGGQLWQQGGRSMTAVNGVIEGMPNTRESAILTAAVEAVEWSPRWKQPLPKANVPLPELSFIPLTCLKKMKHYSTFLIIPLKPKMEATLPLPRF